MNNSYAHLSSFLLPPFFHFSLFISFLLSQRCDIDLFMVAHTGLKAMMMTEPTPLFLKVLLLISLKRKTLKHKDHKEKQSHKRSIGTKPQKYTKMKNLNSTPPTPSPLCSNYPTS
jgi:hypothetical protein